MQSCENEPHDPFNAAPQTPCSRNCSKFLHLPVSAAIVAYIPFESGCGLHSMHIDCEDVHRSPACLHIPLDYQFRGEFGACQKILGEPACPTQLSDDRTAAGGQMPASPQSP